MTEMSGKSNSTGTMKKSVVHIIDDDELLLQTIGMIFDSVGLHHQDYTSADAFLAPHADEAFASMAGCIVCDIRMPGTSGMECQKILNSRNSALPIIFVTGFADVQMAVEAMHEGAFDFVEKPFREQQLLDTTQRALAYNAQLLLSRQTEKEARASLKTLSPRELSVLDLLLEGMPNKKISTTLNISLRTAEVHRARIMEKMAAGNLAELVKMVLAAGA